MMAGGRAFANVVVLACTVLSLGDAHAQGIGSFGQPSMPAGMSAADCEQLARMPNSPISVETCKSMMGMASSYDAAAKDPSAQRSGDDRLSCAQIFAEVQTLDVAGVSEANAAKVEAVVKESTATSQSAAANAASFMAEMRAMGLIAGLTSAYTPNFVMSPMEILFRARLASVMATTKAAQKETSARMDQVAPGISSDFARTMQSNPRFAGLLQLAMAKNCEPPAMPR